MAYATCRWNQRFSSKGSHLIFGRIHLISVLQTGNNKRVPSIVSARPAPREIQTENVSLFNPSRRGSASCLYLASRQRSTFQPTLQDQTHHP